MHSSPEMSAILPQNLQEATKAPAQAKYYNAKHLPMNFALWMETMHAQYKEFEDSASHNVVKLAKLRRSDTNATSQGLRSVREALQAIPMEKTARAFV